MNHPLIFENQKGADVELRPAPAPHKGLTWMCSGCLTIGTPESGELYDDLDEAKDEAAEHAYYCSALPIERQPNPQAHLGEVERWRNGDFIKFIKRR